MVAAVLAQGALVEAANATTRAELNRSAELRFVLKGRTLELTIVDRPNFIRHPTTQSELLGKRLRFACGTSFRPIRRTAVFAQARWPVAGRSFSVRFTRDISPRAKWCLVEAGEGEFAGGDIAYVSFRNPEPGRRLATGALPDGTPWRLAAWRGEQLEPCLSLRVSESSIQTCAMSMAEVDRGIDADAIVPMCSRSTFVLGAVARAARRVVVRTSDGTSVDAQLRGRPRGSRVLAQYFFTALPDPVEVAAVTAYDAAGGVLARDRSVGNSRPTCPRDLQTGEPRR